MQLSRHWSSPASARCGWISIPQAAFPKACDYPSVPPPGAAAFVNANGVDLGTPRFPLTRHCPSPTRKNSPRRVAALLSINPFSSPEGALPEPPLPFLFPDSSVIEVEDIFNYLLTYSFIYLTTTISSPSGRSGIIPTMSHCWAEPDGGNWCLC